MPKKHEATERIGGPGASHENRKHPEKSQARNPDPVSTRPYGHSHVSGGGGESDVHHERNPEGKSGRNVR
jgi:hypothetical protein